MADSLPFSVEYAKSGRAGCRGCRENIEKDSLRIAINVQSATYDGMMQLWHHKRCFWLKNKKKISQIETTDFRGFANLRWEDQEAIRAKLQGGGEEEEETGDSVTAFSMEYAKSARSACTVCSEKIAKGEVKIARQKAWHHLGCFQNSLPKYNFSHAAKDISGFESLIPEDQKLVASTIQPIPKKKKRAAEAGTNGTAKKAKEDPLQALLKKQSDDLWQLTDQLKTLKKSQLADLLVANRQEIPKGEDKILLRLSDVMYFGALEPCEQCGNGQIVFSTSICSYRCVGHMSEWSQCQSTIDKPARRPFSVPKKFLKDYPWMAAYDKRVVGERALPEQRPDAAKASGAAATIAAKANDRYTAYSTAKSSGKSKSTYKSASGSAKVTVKNGVGVEDCEVAAFTHVYQSGAAKTDAWTTTLNSADAASGRNSYYKLQLLEHDSKPNKWYLFRAWGRVGTTIGGTKVENFNSLSEAKSEYKRLYLEKTGNHWEDREHFVKRPGGMYPVDVDFGEDDVSESSIAPGSKSLLPNPVKDLIRLIFDVQAMKSTMKEFEIDLSKMPLGKLSKKQITAAYSVLTELQGLMEQSGQVSDAQAIDASNRFFTLVPHDFGLNKPPILNSLELIRSKTEMLDSLLEIEIAYSILKTNEEGEDPVDTHYKKLSCQISPVSAESEEFKRLAKYVKHTHAATHAHYKLKVEAVFRVERSGEADGFRSDLGNRQLLWHGSRTSNYPGILSQGLRIAPPEAPVTGYMFGKGVYFADMVSKSANYCHAPQNGPGLLLLADVALGQPWELKAAHMVTPALLRKQGKDSVKGLGATAPDPKGDFITPEGVRIPMGKGKATNVTGSTLLYNEYIVYDVNQISLKYLLRTTFVPNY